MQVIPFFLARPRPPITGKEHPMTARIIRGAEIAAAIREEIRADTIRLKEAHGITPGLVTIIVGANPASISYVSA